MSKLFVKKIHVISQRICNFIRFVQTDTNKSNDAIFIQYFTIRVFRLLKCMVN